MSFKSEIYEGFVPLELRDMRAIREDYRLTAIVVVSVLLIVILDVSAIDGSSVEVNEGESNCIP